MKSRATPSSRHAAAPKIKLPAAFDIAFMISNARQASEFLKALSHEVRLLILCFLIEGEKSVSEIEKMLELRQPAVSQQLARLRARWSGRDPAQRQEHLLFAGPHRGSRRHPGSARRVLPPAQVALMCYQASGEYGGRRHGRASRGLAGSRPHQRAGRPFCCYQLAQLGAEVIKVETPGTGDLARQLGADPELNRRGMGASFLAQNRQALDHAEPQAQQGARGVYPPGENIRRRGREFSPRRDGPA